MSSRIMFSSPSRTVLRTQFGGQMRGFFLSTSARMGLKESKTSPDYETHKQDSLSKQKQGKGHWKPELASDSEEAVKADRHSKEEDHKTLQERTKKAAEESSKSGTSMSDSM